MGLESYGSILQGCDVDLSRHDLSGQKSNGDLYTWYSKSPVLKWICSTISPLNIWKHQMIHGRIRQKLSYTNKRATFKNWTHASSACIVGFWELGNWVMGAGLRSGALLSWGNSPSSIFWPAWIILQMVICISDVQNVYLASRKNMSFQKKKRTAVSPQKNGWNHLFGCFQK